MLIIVGKIYVSHFENSYLPPPTTRAVLGDTINTNRKTKTVNVYSREARLVFWSSQYDNMKYLHTGRRCSAVTVTEQITDSCHLILSPQLTDHSNHTVTTTYL